MNKEEVIELDTVIELTDTLGSQAQRAPLSMNGPLSQDGALSRGSGAQSEDVFETLKAPKQSHGESFMPPYVETPHVQAPHVQSVIPACGDDDILELDSSTVVHSQYTVTTELFIDPTEQAPKKKQEHISEKIHVDTVHAERVHTESVYADAMHVGEVHINTIHADKALCDSIKAQQKTQAENPIQSVEPEPIEPQVKRIEQCEDIKDESFSHEELKQILIDISTLKTALASMQLRLAAQESCVASLESRLMLAEAKNKELEAQCQKLESVCVSPDMAQLEQATASIAARVVREEIQALIKLAEQQ